MSAMHSAAKAAALARISAILDEAAQAENVSPTEFRAEIVHAIEHAQHLYGETLPSDCTAEAFVLAVVSQLF